MKKLAIVVVILALALVMSVAVSAGGRPLSAILNGANEVGPGDPDGSGIMNLTLNSGQEEICFDLTVADIASPTRAHIHRAVAGQNGPIVVFFFDTVVDPPIPVAFNGCVNVPRDLVKDIRQNPSDFYVNVHNAEFPGGAIRGQLSK